MEVRHIAGNRQFTRLRPKRMALYFVPKCDVPIRESAGDRSLSFVLNDGTCSETLEECVSQGLRRCSPFQKRISEFIEQHRNDLAVYFCESHSGLIARSYSKVRFSLQNIRRCHQAPRRDSRGLVVRDGVVGATMRPLGM